MNDTASALIERQSPLDLIGIAVDVYTALMGLANSDWEREAAFTQGTVANSMSQAPTKNVLVYHDQGSTFTPSGDVQHEHYQLDLDLGGTKGYEILVFDSGTFKLAGDGGFINWCYGGSFANNPDGSVTFNTTNCTPPADYVDVTHGGLFNREQVSSITFPSAGTTVNWNIFGDSGAAPEATGYSATVGNGSTP
ncbi:uncharacterized protein LTR77_007713 [Saxophila tyrrhenica]|uniref:Uncharacterized protein n=1 Tax=Saxophila tyrrhenica TaxID=1690608 RepID=A0AAV9P2V5_9PEZI|nr:hypothetical protein LTR77_007713 [Saxophila tyrrhenica]